MSRHTIQLISTTASKLATVVIGYDNTQGPHFFCWFQDSAAPQEMLWSSTSSHEFGHAQSPHEFDPILQSHGITLPSFIYQALEEDWAKNMLNCDYCWHADGTFEQQR